MKHPWQLSVLSTEGTTFEQRQFPLGFPEWIFFLIVEIKGDYYLPRSFTRYAPDAHRQARWDYFIKACQNLNFKSVPPPLVCLKANPFSLHYPPVKSTELKVRPGTGESLLGSVKASSLCKLSSMRSLGPLCRRAGSRQRRRSHTYSSNRTCTCKLLLIGFDSRSCACWMCVHLS